MSQIQGKWIEDGAITSAKLDSDATFSMTGLSVAGDATVVGNFLTGGAHITGNLIVDGTAIIHQDQVIYDSLTINQTDMGGEPGILINMIGNGVPLYIDNTNSGGAGIIVNAGSIGFGTTSPQANTHIYDEHNVSLLVDSSSNMNAQSTITAQAWPGGSGVIDTIMQSSGYGNKVGTTTNHDISLIRGNTALIDLVSPTMDSTRVNINCDMTSTGGGSFAGALGVGTSSSDVALYVYGATNYQIVEEKIENTGIGTGTGSKLNLFYPTDSVSLGMQYTAGASSTNGAKIGTFSEHDFWIIRGGENVVSIAFTDATTMTLNGDMTATGNGQFSGGHLGVGAASDIALYAVGAVNNDVVEGKIENTGTGMGVGAKFSINHFTTSLGMQYRSGVGGAKVGTFSETDLNIVRGDVNVMTIAAVGDTTTMTVNGDMTATGNGYFGGGHLGVGTATDLPLYVYGSTVGTVLESKIENAGSGMGYGTKFSVGVPSSAVGLSYQSGVGAKVGTFTATDLNIVRNDANVMTIAAVGDTTTVRINGLVGVGTTPTTDILDLWASGGSIKFFTSSGGPGGGSSIRLTGFSGQMLLTTISDNAVGSATFNDFNIKRDSSAVIRLTNPAGINVINLGDTTMAQVNFIGGDLEDITSGTGTPTIGDPVKWIRVQLSGSSYLLPLYTVAT